MNCSGGLSVASKLSEADERRRCGSRRLQSAAKAAEETR